MTNPSLLSANVDTTSWQVLTTTALSYPIDGAFTGLKPTPNLQGVAVTVNAVEVASAIVFANTTLTIGFIPGSDLPSAAIIEIGFPTNFSFTPGTETCSQVTPSAVSLSCTYASTGGYITSISVTNPCSVSNCLSATAIVYSFTIRVRENTQDVGGSFFVITKTSVSDIGYGSFTNNITISPNPFINTSLNNSGCDTIRATCSLIVKFTTVYTFPNKVSNGKISLTIPSDLTVTSTGCTATIGLNPMECGIAGKSVTATHTETSSVAGQEITITFSSITNPSNTQPTNSFVIYSQEQTSGISYSIDGVVSGLTYAVSGLGAISNAGVVRDSLNVANDGLKVGRNTNFLFTFDIANDVAADGVFTIIMPTDSHAQIDDTSIDFSCSATDCTSGPTLTCSVNNTTRTVQITDYCSNAGGRTCTGGATIIICLKKSFMKNMNWIKTPLLPADSFTIRSGLVGGVYFIDGITSSVVATPVLLPDALSFIFPEITRSSDTVDVKVDYIVYLKFSSNMLNSTGYLVLTLPDDILYDMGENLTVTLETNSSASVTNSKTLYPSGAINTIKINSVCGTSGCAVDSLLNLKIQWAKNPPAQTIVTSTIKINSFTVEGYTIDEGNTAAINTLFSELQIAPVTNIIIDPANPSAGATTDYDIIFTADTDIPINSYVVVTVPTEIVVSATNAGGATVFDTCANIFTSSATLT